MRPDLKLHLMLTAFLGRTHDHVRDDHDCPPYPENDVKSNARLHLACHREKTS